MGRPISRNIKDWLKRARSVHGHKYDYSKVDLSGGAGVTIGCPVHGDFEQNYTQHYLYGCTACANDSMKLDVHGRLADKFPHLTLTGQYANNKTAVEFTCSRHDQPYSFTKRPEDVWKSPEPCPMCHRPTWEFGLHAKALAKYGDKYDYSQIAPNTTSSTTVKLTCDCGHQFETWLSSFLTLDNYDCQPCRKINRLQSTEKTFLAKVAKNPSAKNIRILAEYEGCDARIPVACNDCGHEWSPRAHWLYRHGCPECMIVEGARKALKASYMKRVCVIQGRRFVYMGYEKHAIKYMLRTGKATVDEIDFDDLPTFSYNYKGKNRTYFPDFKVRDNIVEVKSTYTFAHHADLFEIVKRKRQAVIDAGYKFQLLVMNHDGTRLVVPTDWHRLTFTALHKLM